jgi:hypothetical protein
MKLTKIFKIKFSIFKRNLSIDSFSSEDYLQNRDKVIKRLIEGKIPTIRAESVRRPEHNKIMAKDFYNAVKNPKLFGYLNKQRNIETRFVLYEHCIKILVENKLKLNNFNLALDLGCGSIKQNNVIYQGLNEKYLKKPTLWYGIDTSKFMLEYDNPLLLPNYEIYKNENYFENILCDLKDIDKFQPNIAFDFCISVSMLQWLSHSKLSFNDLNRNLTSLFGFLYKFLSPDGSGVAIFQFYPDSLKNITNILDFLSLSHEIIRFDFILYKSCPQNNDAKKWFLFLKKI